ncbi:MAG: XisI protein [Chloroflexota bacterium]
MDSKITKYRKIIKHIFDDYMALLNRKSQADIDTFAIIDDKNDHYLIQVLGWDEIRKVWETSVYVRIFNNKFWIEVDWTEMGIGNDLVAAGVPKEDIVLAFHHPSTRQFTDFAIA